MLVRGSGRYPPAPDQARCEPSRGSQVKPGGALVHSPLETKQQVWACRDSPEAPMSQASLKVTGPSLPGSSPLHTASFEENRRRVRTTSDQVQQTHKAVVTPQN
jgi:hypothetical protein